MSPTELVGVIATIAGTLGLRELVAKIINRKADAVVDQKVKVETAKTEVEILRDVLAEVRADSASKTTKLLELDERVAKLEERERHQLTRAAVHEAWDQMAFQFILQHNPQHPPPPPLVLGRTIEDDANDLVDYFDNKKVKDDAE